MILIPRFRSLSSRPPPNYDSSFVCYRLEFVVLSVSEEEDYSLNFNFAALNLEKSKQFAR